MASKLGGSTEVWEGVGRTNGDDKGLVYVGHLPHGFYEDQLSGYFSQFGTVTKVKVARNKKV